MGVNWCDGTNYGHPWIGPVKFGNLHDGPLNFGLVNLIKYNVGPFERWLTANLASFYSPGLEEFGIPAGYRIPAKAFANGDISGVHAFFSAAGNVMLRCSHCNRWMRRYEFVEIIQSDDNRRDRHLAWTNVCGTCFLKLHKKFVCGECGRLLPVTHADLNRAGTWNRYASRWLPRTQYRIYCRACRASHERRIRHMAAIHERHETIHGRWIRRKIEREEIERRLLKAARKQFGKDFPIARQLAYKSELSVLDIPKDLVEVVKINRELKRKAKELSHG